MLSDDEVAEYLGLDQASWHPDQWRNTLRSEKVRSGTWYVGVMDVLETAYRRQMLTPSFFLQLAGIMVQMADTMDGVIFLDENTRRIDPAGVAKTEGWRDLVNKRASAIESAIEGRF